jgi:cytoskeletal protein RodZ
MRGAIQTILGLSLSSVLVGCGGSNPEAKEPESTSSVEAPSSSSSAKDSAEAASKETAGGDEKGASDEKSDKSHDSKSGASEEKKPLRSAKDIITRQDVLFVFSFTASEPHQVAEKKCAEKSGDDPKKKADCMSKAGQSFDGDGMAFTEVDGKWWWLTVRRKGTGLVTLHKVEIDFGDDGEKQITIKPHGPDKGTKPGGLPKELVIEVPSESEIAVTDPKQGRLVYEAKMGLMGKNER